MWMLLGLTVRLQQTRRTDLWQRDILVLQYAAAQAGHLLMSCPAEVRAGQYEDHRSFAQIFCQQASTVASWPHLPAVGMLAHLREMVPAPARRPAARRGTAKTGSCGASGAASAMRLLACRASSADQPPRSDLRAKQQPIICVCSCKPQPHPACQAASAAHCHTWVCAGCTNATHVIIGRSYSRHHCVAGRMRSVLVRFACNPVWTAHLCCTK